MLLSMSIAGGRKETGEAAFGCSLLDVSEVLEIRFKATGQGQGCDRSRSGQRFKSSVFPFWDLGMAHSHSLESRFKLRNNVHKSTT